MSMTTELIKELHSCADYINAVSAEEINTLDVTKTLYNAADAIEELSAKLHASQMERSSQYYHGGWIPCDEALPEHTDDYLVTVGVNYGGEGMFSYIRTATYNTVFKTWTVHEVSTAIVGEPTAWRPLPEPYSPNDEEVENADNNCN